MADSKNPQVPEARERESEPASEVVTISRKELDALLARLEAKVHKGRIDAEDPADLERGPEPSGNADRGPDGGRLRAEELAARESRFAEMERACKAAVREREIATALAGRPLVSGAAAQLLKLWSDELDVYEEDGTYKVAARDGRPVSQAVGEWLASPEYAHFCLPPS
jgi:hypothetical protein